MGSVTIVRFIANKGDQGSISISANTLASTVGSTAAEVFMAVREGGASSTILTNYKSTTGAYGTNDVDEVQYLDCICQDSCSGSFTLSFRGDGPSAVGRDA